MSDSPLPNEGDKNAPADAEVTTPAIPPAAEADPAPAAGPETDADPAPAAEADPAPNAPPSNPNITCKRCGTVTNWNPYCPTCGAYLEFMGVPSWSPTEVTSTVPEPKPPAPEPTEPVVVVEPAVTQTSEEPVEAEPLPADAPHHRRHGLHLGHHHDDAVDADSVDDGSGPVDTKPIPWWAFWRHPKAPKAADPSATTASTDPAAATGDSDLSPAAALVTQEETNVNVIPAHPTVDVVAELPQEEEEKQQRTRRSILTEENTRGPAVECPHCGHQNPIDHAYCEWCGTYLSTYRLAPVPPVIKEATGTSGSGDSTSSPVRQAWRKSYLLYIILALVVFLIWFFFWGPMATTTRDFFEETGQKISEYIFPKLGEETSVASITASSSLPGTTPTSLNQASSVDYWASEEMNGLGVGTTITFTFTQCYPIDRIIVAPGIQDSDLDVQALAQPKDISMTFSPSGTIQTELLEAPTSNELYTQIMSFPATYATSVTVSIDSVYPSRYVITPDPNFGAVAISSLNFLQSPSVSTVEVFNPFRSGGESSSASAAPSSAASGAPSSAASGAPSSAASGAPAPSGTSSPSASASATPSSTVVPCAAPGTTPSPTPSASASSSASPTTTSSPSATPAPSTASATATKTPQS